MYFRYNVKSKAKNKHKGELRGLALLLFSFLLTYCLVLPAQSGSIGQSIARILFLFLGRAAYLLPILIVWWGYSFLRNSTKYNWRIDLIWAILLLCVASSFLMISGNVFFKLNYGGWLGLKLGPFFRRLFGAYISLIVTFGLLVYLTSLIMRISLKNTLLFVWQKLVEDYRQWQKARAEIRKMQPPKIKSSEPDKKPVPKQMQPQPRPSEVKTEPKILTPVYPEPPASKAQKSSVTPKDKKEKPKEDKKPDQIPQEEKPPITFDYKLPALDLLTSRSVTVVEHSHDQHLANAENLTKTLEHFNISCKVKEIIPGPVVTRYDIELAPGIKLQAVTALSDNIALAMKVPSVRIISVPEKSAVGIEVPNSKTKTVGLKSVIGSSEFQDSQSLLTLALGRTTDGAPYVTDLAPMPHLLIAGATGSGKSVCIHSLISSILYKARPDEVKFLLIDPKRLELPIYRGIPHLYDPSVTAGEVDIIIKPKEAALSLKKLVRVMEKRYEKFAKETVRNIEAYNEKMMQTGRQKEFYIVVIIDELADLMLIATKDVEDSIQRLAQMARAVGIHLILATQRPSVDVITGVIKANFPARIAFQTTSKVDSRVILDTIGAEDLFGKGDMLFIPPGESRQIRLQGCMISSKEVESVVKFIKEQNVPAYYEDLFAKAQGFSMHDDEDDKSMKDLVKALNLVQERKRVSQDLLKAHFGSSARATNILSLLETKGFINKPEGTNRWQINFDKIEEYISAAVKNES
ncbi:MAG: DNA translocase FtsK 4TM domain-containing protein [Endomicrobiales bacterium]|nr:DNA translocase FtsK 4TM domain-containing protein [Endomicrobiales bacterium]